jgi:hypothetical protein
VCSGWAEDASCRLMPARLAYERWFRSGGLLTPGDLPPASHDRIRAESGSAMVAILVTSGKQRATIATTTGAP